MNLPPDEPLQGTSVPDMPYVIVTDDAFPSRPDIMKPYAGDITSEMRIFDYRLSRSRKTSENGFGITSARLRELGK